MREQATGVPLKSAARGHPRLLGSIVRQDVLERCHATPVAYEPDAGNGTLVVAMDDPRNLQALDEIAFASGMRVRAVSRLGELPPEGRATSRGDAGAPEFEPIDFRPDPNLTTGEGWFFSSAETLGQSAGKAAASQGDRALEPDPASTAEGGGPRGGTEGAG